METIEASKLEQGVVFHRASEECIIAPNLRFSGKKLEFKDKNGRPVSIPIFLHDPPKLTGFLQFRQLVFPANRLPIKMEVSEYMVVRINGTTYLPLDALFIELYQQGVITKDLLEVMREYPHPKPVKISKNVPSRVGQLVGVLEKAGFVLDNHFTPNPKDSSFRIQPILWRRYRRGSFIRAASIKVRLGTKPKFSWFKPASTDLTVLFTNYLQTRFPHAQHIFTEKGVQFLSKSEEPTSRIK
jgi:hypothetical protein